MTEANHSVGEGEVRERAIVLLQSGLGKSVFELREAIKAAHALLGQNRARLSPARTALYWALEEPKGADATSAESKIETAARLALALLERDAPIRLQLYASIDDLAAVNVARTNLRAILHFID